MNERQPSKACTCPVPLGEAMVCTPSGKWHHFWPSDPKLRGKLRWATKLGWTIKLIDRCWTCGELPALPEGATCASCVHTPRCVSMFGEHPDSRSCQFMPVRFRARQAA